MKRRTIPAFIGVMLFAVLQLAAQTGKRPLTHDVYDSWKSISSQTISPRGNWVLYLEVPQDGDGRIVVYNPGSGTDYSHGIGYTGEGTEAERAARPRFSYDESRIVFLISPSQEEVKEAEKDKKKKDDTIRKLGLIQLAAGSVTLIDSVKSFAMPEKKGGWLAYLVEKASKKEKKEKDKKEEKKEEEGKSKEGEKKKEKKKDFGTRLVLLGPNGKERIIESVIDYQFTKDGTFLFYTVSSEEHPETDGLYRLNPAADKTVVLLSGQGNYKRLSFNKDETMLAFLSDRDDYAADTPTFNLYGCGVEAPQADLWVSHKSTESFPEGMAVSDKSALSFNDEGSVIMFGIKEIPAEENKEEENGEKEEEAEFELWHWQDPYPYPQQKKMAQRVKDNTWESVYYIKSKKFLKLADEKLPDLSLGRHGRVAFANDNWPHAKKMSYFGDFNDVYVVDTGTGGRKLVKEDLFGQARLSPNDCYVYWFEGKDWFVYDINKNRTANVTAGLGVHFDREDHDRPEPASPYGIAGWTDKDRSLLVYDRYDVWEISPDGKDRRLITEGFGREHDLSFRYIRLDREAFTIDPGAEILLGATNEETMASGFYLDRVEDEAPPRRLIMEDKNFGRPSKADEADLLLWSRSDFDEYPDLWISGLDFSRPRKITDLGSQMDPYLWGHEELIDFTSADGKPLKGILIKPENFDPAKKYPLMVYIYETLHDRLHSYRNPSPGTSINFSYYVSNGYLLWMPDIEYETGYPGRDALKCVLPGIQLLVQKGLADEKAIGIQGHSWGGYQIAYMVTQTDIFAAAEAGAPVSNMTSAYDGIRWGSGMVRQFQYEKTQSRLGASLWEVPLRYLENSPIFWADRVHTPLLMIHNDADGAVPWYQGIEYIMALRRLSKEAYMFNYNGEDHGLRKRINQKDWTVRLQQFFDHFLKGAPEPDWMAKGIQAWEKE